MEIVEPYAKLISPAYSDLSDGIAMLSRIESAGRVSHRSEDAAGNDTWKRFIQTVVMHHGDWSIVEHESATVEFLVDRGITHELVRHRHFSYTQESTRFVNYQKKLGLQFINPFDWQPDPEDENWRLGSTIWQTAMVQSEQNYNQLIAVGCAPQIARSVLPNALASKVIMTGNLRAWRHFFIMRTTIEAHPQMRQVTIPLLRDFKGRIPLLYDDIEPNVHQSEHLMLPE